MKEEDEDQAYLRCLEEMRRLRRFPGEPGRFWGAFLSSLLSLGGAEAGLIAVKGGPGGQPWRLLAVHPLQLASPEAALALLAEAGELVSRCLRSEAASLEVKGRLMQAIRLETGGEADECLALLVSSPARNGGASRRLERLRSFRDLPADYQLARGAAESKARVDQLAKVMDLLILLNAQSKFLPAAMAFCNELASRFGCERVSLGWVEGGSIRLKAISRIDRFERKTEAVQLTEAAMEEAFDQDSEVLLPVGESGGPVRRDHERLASSSDCPSAASVPLRVGGEPVAVCTCQRGEAFTEVELRLLRLACDQVSARLSELLLRDRWLGARAAAALKKRLGEFLGPTHTWAKVIVLLCAVLAGILLFGGTTYRVKAAAALRTEELVHLTAPFDSRIDLVSVRPGDEVEKGQVLLTLDRTDLLLREAEQVAEASRYEREVEKARGAGALADMRISVAERDQAFARLALVRSQLQRSELRAPFDGVVVEGDLSERIGSPVGQGEPLLKLGRLENLYAELEVDEVDIHEMKETQAGELALASRPGERIGIRVTRIEPVATAKDKRNVFIVRAALGEGRRDWWRPGMSGVARLDVGRRNLLWILGHGTLDFLRLRLWW